MDNQDQHTMDQLPHMKLVTSVDNYIDAYES
jgi:hypothetical protein